MTRAAQTWGVHVHAAEATADGINDPAYWKLRPIASYFGKRRLGYEAWEAIDFTNLPLMPGRFTTAPVS